MRHTQPKVAQLNISQSEPNQSLQLKNTGSF